MSCAVSNAMYHAINAELDEDRRPSCILLGVQSYLEWVSAFIDTRPVTDYNSTMRMESPHLFLGHPVLVDSRVRYGVRVICGPEDEIRKFGGILR